LPLLRWQSNIQIARAVLYSFAEKHIGGKTMLRKIIRIDEEKCNGCGACARACHEGAIAMVNGKARLMREDYCDGLGDCLPACPTGAISFETREAAAYDEAAVKAAKAAAPHACPGSRPAAFKPAAQPAGALDVPSQLSQWPVQIKLAPVNAPWFADADLLIAADCTAFAYGNFHADFITRKSSRRSLPPTPSAPYSSRAWRFPAAAVWKAPCAARWRCAAKTYRSPFP